MLVITKAGVKAEHRVSRRERRRLRMLSALAGRRCIYKEGGLVCVVRVVSSEMTQEGVFLQLEVLRRLAGNGPEHFMAGASREALNVSSKWSLRASWVNWILIVRSDERG